MRPWYSSKEQFFGKFYQIFNPNLPPEDGLWGKSYSFSTKLNCHLLVRYLSGFSAIYWKCQYRKKNDKNGILLKGPPMRILHTFYIWLHFFASSLGNFFMFYNLLRPEGQDWYTGICLWLPLASYLLETFFKCVLSVRNGFWKYNHFNEIRFHKFHRRNDMRTNNDQELSFSEANTRRCSYERL